MANHRFPPLRRHPSVVPLGPGHAWHGSLRVGARARRVPTPGTPAASPVAAGLRWMAAGRHREAEQVLAEAWGQAPTVPVARLLARLRHRAEGAAAALRFVVQARARFPGAPRLVSEEARCLESLGRWEEAARAWARLREMRPGDPRAPVAYVAASVRALPAEAAIAELGSLLRLPRLSGELELHRLRARLLEQTGRPVDALRAWRAAAAAAPRDPRIGVDLVFALRRCGRPAEAFPGLLALVAAHPRRMPALAALVADAKALGRVAQARRLLIDLARHDPELHHLWGWVRRLGPCRARPPVRTDGR